MFYFGFVLVGDFMQCGGFNLCPRLWVFVVLIFGSSEVCAFAL